MENRTSLSTASVQTKELHPGSHKRLTVQERVHAGKRSKNLRRIAWTSRPRLGSYNYPSQAKELAVGQKQWVAYRTSGALSLNLELWAAGIEPTFSRIRGIHNEIS
ncbi:hypothetical protein PtA15_7A447 [Puccinia triticina]|uniref:Uncharacterized protein n=1 Tax=Puccinia triticina TaxID=208348 RepID=A0ABY7CNI8_9BASI|nr:uncharacterized protein PtA15_7A447 [Puccinia triticina]WAQ86719.1 hypothetical protein PtA15_7A447 [Puccinia triticina]